MGRLAEWRHSESFAFAVTTVVLATVIGVSAFLVGRGWIGRYLAEREEDTPAAALPESPEEPGPGVAPGPMSPRVVIREREPTEAEKRELAIESGQPLPDPSAPEVGAAAEDAGQPLLPGPEEEAGASEAGGPRGEPSAGEPVRSASPDAGTPSPARPAASWTATAGSYRDRRNAEQVAASLADQGLDADIERVTVRGQTFYRVRAGRYSSKSDAEAAGRKVEAAGYPSSVVPTH